MEHTQIEHTHSQHRDSVVPEKNQETGEIPPSFICPACRYYTHPGDLHERHDFACPHMPCDSARYYLAVLHKEYRERHARQRAADQTHTYNNKRILLERDAAEGKWRRLKEENNALRSNNHQMMIENRTLQGQLDQLTKRLKALETPTRNEKLPPRDLWPANLEQLTRPTPGTPALYPHHYIQDMVTTSEE